MALDGVPFWIGGDAEHGGDSLRMLAYLAAGGKQGVVAPTDLKVLALDVPGPGVKVLAGGASILNRVSSQEAYTARNPVTDADSVKVPATGSASGQSYLVVLRVDNPNVDGNAQAPADPKKGPYNRFDALPVPAGTRRLKDVAAYSGMSAIELARIDMPKSTGTVLSSMIVDLRQLETPRSTRYVLAGVLPSTAQAVTLSDAFKAFPSGGIPNVQIPEWATHMAARIDTTYSGVSGSPYFQVRAFISSTDQQTDTYFSTQTVDGTSVAATGVYRSPMVLPTDGTFPVPARLRGTTQTFQTLVKGVNSGVGAVIKTNPSDYFVLDVTFTEQIS